MAASSSGQSWAVLAASEQGKGVWLKGWLQATKPARLLVWDRNDEYSDHAERAPTLAGLHAACRAPAFRLRYVPRARTGKRLQDEFEAFCMVAFEAGRAVVVVEELADVTSASFAPPAWRQLNTRGRHHKALHIIGLSQTPATIDKAFLANATMLHVGYLGTAAHRRAVAEELDCDPDRIKALQRFEFLQYRRDTRELKPGRVVLPTHKPAGKATKRAA